MNRALVTRVVVAFVAGLIVGAAGLAFGAVPSHAPLPAGTSSALPPHGSSVAASATAGHWQHGFDEAPRHAAAARPKASAKAHRARAAAHHAAAQRSAGFHHAAAARTTRPCPARTAPTPTAPRSGGTNNARHHQAGHAGSRGGCGD
jgi:hypothetical protein